MSEHKLSNPTTDKGTEGGLNIPHLLKVKRDGGQYTQKEIRALVSAISDGSMEDVQLGAFLMGVYQKGMTSEETAYLTEAMKNSGTVFEWPSTWTVVDKHSTGGVGDKISLILVPALASKGLKVPMISGRGLEHTGGTLDKLESIPGYRVLLTETEMMTSLEDVGCCIVGQTGSIVPADKRMYAARDVTSTVPSIPLIVGSIISKKACESLNSLVLDVKFGSGSFMGCQAKTECLAEALVTAGKDLGIKTCALVTCMDNPIGRKIGNALEIEEALQCLRGEGPEDLTELVLSLGAELLLSVGHSSTLEDGKNELLQTLKDGSALKTFSRMMEAQGVSPDVTQRLCGQTYDTTVLPRAKHSTQLLSQQTGKITGIDALTVAKVCFALGAGRATTNDRINHAVGMVLLKTVGDEITEGQAWAEIRHDKPLEKSIRAQAESAVTLNDTKQILPLIAKRIS